MRRSAWEGGEGRREAEAFSALGKHTSGVSKALKTSK